MNHMKEENNPQWVDEDAIMNSIINYINNLFSMRINFNIS